MIMAALSIFQTWICVGVIIGNFLSVVGVRNIFNTKLHGLGACWHLIGCLFHGINVCGLHAVME
jgi:hypothetical protein